MIEPTSSTPVSLSRNNVGVSLVDGDATVRHARQIMLRSEHYDVRSYATGAALLADPRSRGFACIVLDIMMNEIDGFRLLHEMRATGWRGKGLLLDNIVPGNAMSRDAERHGDRVLERSIADGPLIAAIAASLDRPWTGWHDGS
jgi:FixJ family two-component response regulator